MITDAPSARQLAGAVTWEPVVTSWLGGEWLADVPVSSGSITWSVRRQVPGTFELTVPRHHDGVDWWPGRDVAHPLARYGQELNIAVRVSSPVSGRTWTIQRGRFLVSEWRDQGGTIRVSGPSIFQRIEDSRFTSPTPSAASGTLATELRRLLPASIGMVVDGSLTSRSAPRLAYGESRMDAVQEVVSAWPARLREDRYGRASVLPPLPEIPTPADWLTDGEGGTVVSAYREDTREGVYNVVVARGQTTTDAGVPAHQYVAEQTTGPMSCTGPYGYVPRFFSSQFIDTYWAARNAAKAMLADAILPSRVIPVTLAPDPRWELDDGVGVRVDGDTFLGWVSGVQLPLTTADGDMRMDVEVA